MRDYQLALADHEAEARAVDRGLVGGGRTESVALLLFAADSADWRTHLLVRSIFERQLPFRRPLRRHSFEMHALETGARRAECGARCRWGDVHC